MRDDRIVNRAQSFGKQENIGIWKKKNHTVYAIGNTYQSGRQNMVSEFELLQVSELRLNQPLRCINEVSQVKGN